MTKKIRIIGTAILGAIWMVLAVCAWFGPTEEISDAERRQLAQFPEISGKTVLNGKFMSEFEDYTLDQFPLRDALRQVKALFHYNVLQQSDNNGIYIADGYAAELEYPLNEASVSNAVEKFNSIYESYLKDTGSAVVMTVIPDKGYYLAEKNGYPTMDYEALFAQVQEGTPWADFVDIADLLSEEDYYRTDTHWRQEAILDVAQRLCQALEVSIPEEGAFDEKALEQPFYGVYYGQAALPMEPETICLMESDALAGCTVYNHETGKPTAVYDLDKLDSRDLYDVYLSGAAALLTIKNPAASSDRELIVFRDSFGSSLVPLLVSDYKTVTLVDIRYISSDFLGQFIDFCGQDVLFAYSTLVLNNSSTLK